VLVLTQMRLVGYTPTTNTTTTGDTKFAVERILDLLNDSIRKGGIGGSFDSNRFKVTFKRHLDRVIDISIKHTHNRTPDGTYRPR